MTVENIVGKPLAEKLETGKLMCGMGTEGKTGDSWTTG